eukprot:4591506-Pyramimonas_sp.AAC.1
MAAEEALTRAQQDCCRGDMSEGGFPSPPPPPPPLQLCLPPPCPEAVSILSSSHALDDSGRRCR